MQQIIDYTVKDLLLSDLHISLNFQGRLCWTLLILWNCYTFNLTDDE